MELTFYKYQGTGNDFVMIDNRDLRFPADDAPFIQHLCDRRFGIGADGLILLNPSKNHDFEMVYFNADGREGTMCGNGGRCLVAFAHDLKAIGDKTTFEAVDGIHHASIEEGLVSLQMIDVSEIQIESTHAFLDTGSPHHVELVENIGAYDVFANGKRIRNGAPYFHEGTNVNFVEATGADSFRVRTYETGATAVAIAMHAQNHTQANSIQLKVEGGALEVSFLKENDSYQHVFLKGPAKFVFKGKLSIKK
jgi:diaminopimelate epimerase